MIKRIIAITILILLVLLFVFYPEFGKKELKDDTIKIASWNLKNIGNTKFNDPARIDIIIDIMKDYDIIAVQEVKDVSLQLPQKLAEKMNEDGSNYNVVASERVGRNVFEQYIFLYDDNKIDVISGTGGYGIEPNDEFAREPFYTKFKAGNFDFYLMNIHTDPDDVSIEIPALKESFIELQNSTSDEDDIILLGDFNAKAPGVSASSYFTMDAFSSIPNIVFTINEETNTRGGKAYDNIIFQGNYTSEYAETSGVNTFWLTYGLTEDEGFAISDHKLVWAEFNIASPDDD